MSDVVTDELVAFIKARLDEDERDKQHIVPPALWQRWLAGVEAKRRMLALHAQGHECPALVTDPYPHVTDYYHGDCPTIIAMVSEWSTHEAYREEWKP